jgi:hypothetical protein
MVGQSDLSAIMVEAQKKAFGDLLDPDGYVSSVSIVLIIL